MMKLRRDSALQPFAFAVLAACALALPNAAGAQQNPAALTVELGDVSLTKLPFIMAADYGIYENNGLKVKQYITPSAAKAVEAKGVKVPAENIGREQGDINIGGGSPTMVRMTSVTTAPQRVILATTDIYSRYHILARGDIKTAADVKGKRIGYGNPGALSHFSLLMYLKSIGVDPEKDVSMFSNGGDIENVLSGKVDIIAANGITVDEAKAHGMNSIANLIPQKIHMPGSGVNAEKAWLAKNRDVAARFVKATVEAIALMKNDKEKAFASMRKWYGINDTKVLEGVYAEAVDLPIKPYPSIEGLKNMQSVYTWREITRYQPEEFTDASFVTELDKSGYIDSLYRKTDGAAK
jgi:ABC-type nitrate/sulfonate/bicarbonate transport system substrate-binding protein